MDALVDKNPTQHDHPLQNDLGLFEVSLHIKKKICFSRLREKRHLTLQ